MHYFFMLLIVAGSFHFYAIGAMNACYWFLGAGICFTLADIANSLNNIKGLLKMKDDQ